MTNPDDDPDRLRAIINRATAQARAEATDADGRVDALKEALAFRRLIVEAAVEGED